MSEQDFESRTLEILHRLKHDIAEPRASPAIPVVQEGRPIARLRVLTTRDAQEERLIRLLARWREENFDAYLTRSKITVEGTQKWLESGVLENKDRLLFLLEDADGRPVGHMGFYRFDFAQKSCEVDNIVRGETRPAGVMTPALQALMRWGMEVLQMSELRLQTFADNKRAIALYERCGFRETGRSPLTRMETPDKVEYAPTPPGGKADREWLRMRYNPRI